MFDFDKMELLLTYAVWSPFSDWTLSSLSVCILLEGHYILKNSVLGPARQDKDKQYVCALIYLFERRNYKDKQER